MKKSGPRMQNTVLQPGQQIEREKERENMRGEREGRERERERRLGSSPADRVVFF